VEGTFSFPNIFPYYFYNIHKLRNLNQKNIYLLPLSDS
jgi:hypothetical protein